jgi:hypothetical protein
MMSHWWEQIQELGEVMPLLTLLLKCW